MNLAKIRVREHVNPLCQKYQTPLIPPDWNRVYADVNLPLHLDIGCARGQFLLQMARLQPHINFLGIEIREPLVEEANWHRDRLALTNLHYVFGNINNSSITLLDSLTPRVLNYVTIQFPDPWFKQKHVKRRVVTPKLVNDLATYSIDGGMVFLQSDVESLAKQMHDRFRAHPSFQRKHPENWLTTNPLPVATERENLTLVRNLPVYRALFVKSSQISCSNPTT